MTIQVAVHTGIIALLLILVSACASQPDVGSSSFPLLTSWTPQQIVDDDLLGVSDDMERFLSNHVYQYTRPHRRLRELSYSINHKGLLGYEYDVSKTLIAADSFNIEAGNCVAFANMFIAMARAAGLEARYQEVKVPPSWSERSEVMVLSMHINVRVRIRNKNYTVDIAGRKTTNDEETRTISDTSGKAYYYNNLGVDALFDEDLAAAHAYLIKALQLDSSLSFIWSNLGIVYKRNKQLDDATWALLKGLKVDREAHSAMRNLAEIYRLQGKREEAQALQARAEASRLQNPYYLLLLSEDAVADLRYAEAIKLLKRAVRLKRNGYRLHFALARSFYLSGEVEKAELSYQRARALAPVKVAKNDLNLPLADIMLSYQLSPQIL